MDFTCFVKRYLSQLGKLLRSVEQDVDVENEEYAKDKSFWEATNKNAETDAEEWSKQFSEAEQYGYFEEAKTNEDYFKAVNQYITKAAEV